MKSCQLSTLAANVATGAVTDLLAGGMLCVYRGDRPASSDAPEPVQERLLRIPLGDPAFTQPEQGLAHARQTWESDPAEATGQAVWFRAFASDGTAVFDGSVGEEFDDDLMLNDATLKAGTVVFVRAFTFTAAVRLQPEV